MQTKLAIGWGIFAVVLPTAIGIMLLVSPASFLPEGTELADLAMINGFRNIALSLVLLAAIVMKEWRTLGFLLLVRALSEFGDATGTLISSGKVDVTVISPVILGIISIVAGYYLIKTYPKITE